MPSRAPVGGDHVAAVDEGVEDLAPLRILEVEGDAALASVGAEAHVGAGPERVVQCVDLDHVGAKVGEHLRSERTGHPEAQVEHADALERGGEGGAAPAGGNGRPRRRERAEGSDRRAHPARRGRELEHVADVADASPLGVVELHDAAVGEQGGIGEGLARAAHEGDTHPRLLPDVDPVRRGEPAERLGERRIEERADQQVGRLHPDPVRVAAVVVLEVGNTQGIPAGHGGDPLRADRPVVDPPPVGALEEALDRPGVDRPHPVHRGVGVLDPLPVEGDGGEGPLQQRRLDPLPGAGDLSRSERGADAERRQERGAEARPRRAREQRPVPAGTTHQPFGRPELGVGPRPPADVLHRRPRPAPVVVKDAGPGRHQRVVAGAGAVAVVPPVAGDRAVDQARVGRGEGGVVHAEAAGHARRERLHDHVRPGGELHEGVPPRRPAQVERAAALAPLPDHVARLAAEGVAAGGLDAGHGRTVVGQQHGRHRTGDPPREVEHLDPVEDAGRGGCGRHSQRL